MRAASGVVVVKAERGHDCVYRTLLLPCKDQDFAGYHFPSSDCSYFTGTGREVVVDEEASGIRSWSSRSRRRCRAGCCERRRLLVLAVVEASEGQRKSGAGARGGTTGVMDASRASRAGEGLQGVTVDDGGGVGTMD